MYTKQNILVKLFTAKHISHLEKAQLIFIIITNNEDVFKKKAWNRLTMKKMRADNNDYLQIILNGPEIYQTKAWDLFIKNKPTTENLLSIVFTDNDTYYQKALEMLFTYDLTNEDLVNIIENTFDKNRTKALNMLFHNNPTDNQLTTIICYGDNKIATEGWALLNEKNISIDLFIRIMKKANPTHQMKAWNLVAGRLSTEDLAKILCQVEHKTIVDTAWKKFSSSHYGYKDFEMMMRNCKNADYKTFLVDQALSRTDLVKKELLGIIQYYDDQKSKSQAAELLFTLRPTNAELDIVIKHCNDEKDTVSRAKMFYSKTTESLFKAYQEYIEDEKKS